MTTTAHLIADDCQQSKSKAKMMVNVGSAEARDFVLDDGQAGNYVLTF
jgi:hypothetical protein